MKPFTVAISSFFAFAFVVTVKAQTPAFTRTDFHVACTDGVQVFVREVTSGEPREGKVAVILVHGARVPGLASFDLEVANGSLAEEIARNGHPVYIMDARGYGQSTQAAALDQPAEQNLPAVRGYEVVRDIEAVVREVKLVDRDRATGRTDRTCTTNTTYMLMNPHLKPLWPLCTSSRR